MGQREAVRAEGTAKLRSGDEMGCVSRTPRVIQVGSKDGKTGRRGG